jgi:hypothetical protein
VKLDLIEFELEYLRCPNSSTLTYPPIRAYIGEYDSMSGNEDIASVSPIGGMHNWSSLTVDINGYVEADFSTAISVVKLCDIEVLLPFHTTCGEYNISEVENSTSQFCQVFDPQDAQVIRFSHVLDSLE